MIEPGFIRVLLVDDSDIVRMSITVLIETVDGIVVVGEADNGQRAIELCNQLQPDVVLMDLIMPEMNGVAAIRVIHEQHPLIAILALSSTVEVDLIEAALQAGAGKYVSKNTSSDALIQAIYDVIQL